MTTPSDFDSPASELDLDLHFLPAWAQRPPSENAYSKFEGEERERHGRRGPRPPRRPEGERRREGERLGARRERGAPGEGRRPDPRRLPERREPQAPPLEIDVQFLPEERGVESLARQIRLTGRAYPLFDIAYLILKKPDRYQTQFNVIKRPDGQPAQPLFVCSIDETLWPSEAEAMGHILSKHFEMFYQPEKTPADPPKGTYTFVAQCGITGEIFGPPNYHDYQNRLRRLHAERFSRMPFDVYKSRVRIVKDEAIVKKWLEEQSFKTEYICLNVPEPLKLSRREDVEKHFRETHLANVVRPAETFTLPGAAAQQIAHPALRAAARRALDEQMRFPLRVVTLLSQQFASHGLQFFKVKKSITHVAVARPRYLDLETTSVSPGVRRIIDFISATPHCTRRALLQALAPASAVAAPPAPAAGEAPPSAGPEAPPSPEVAELVRDLHWLIHEGHVIEFANGLMELAKKPAVKPPSPAAKPAAGAAEPSAAASPTEAATSAAESSGAEPESGSTDLEPGGESETPVASQPPESTQIPHAGNSSEPLREPSLPAVEERATASADAPSAQPAPSGAVEEAPAKPAPESPPGYSPALRPASADAAVEAQP